MPRQGQNVYRLVNIPEFPSPVGTKSNWVNLIGEIIGKTDISSLTGFHGCVLPISAINILSLTGYKKKGLIHMKIIYNTEQGVMTPCSLYIWCS